MSLILTSQSCHYIGESAIDLENLPKNTKKRFLVDKIEAAHTMPLPMASQSAWFSRHNCQLGGWTKGGHSHALPHPCTECLTRPLSSHHHIPVSRTLVGPISSSHHYSQAMMLVSAVCHLLASFHN